MTDSLCKILSKPFYTEDSQPFIEQEALDRLRTHPREKDSQTLQGVKAIHLAALNGHIAVLNELVRLGVDINERHVSNRLSVVHFAAMGSRCETFDAVKELGADLTAVDVDGSNILDVIINAFMDTSDPKSLDLIAKILNETGIRPGEGIGQNKIIKVCLEACRLDHYASLKAIYMSGIHVPYIINEVSGLNMLVETSLRSLSVGCLGLLHDELAMPLGQDDRPLEREDTYEKSDPYELVFDSLPVTEVFAVPKMFQSEFTLRSTESALSSDVQQRARATALALFSATSLNPDARVRYDRDEEKFYIESLYLGGVKFLFDVSGELVNQKELLDRLFSLVNYLKESEFFYSGPDSARSGDYSKLFHLHPFLLDSIVTNGFELIVEDINYAIDNSHPEMIMYLAGKLLDLTVEQVNNFGVRLRCTSNEKVVGRESEIISCFESLKASISEGCLKEDVVDDEVDFDTPSKDVSEELRPSDSELKSIADRLLSTGSLHPQAARDKNVKISSWESLVHPVSRTDVNVATGDLDSRHQSAAAVDLGSENERVLDVSVGVASAGSVHKPKML